MKNLIKHKKLAGLLLVAASQHAQADENLLGYISGAETLPQGASEAYLWLTKRWDKGTGHYAAYDSKLEYEHGLTHRLTGSIAIKGQSIDTNGLVIDGYLPGAEKYGIKPSGVDAAFKYNFLSPAKDDIGLSGKIELAYSWLDPHSGQDKHSTQAEFSLQVQKYFLDDQLVALINTGLEATYAVRDPLSPALQSSADAAMQALTGDPAATFDWPTKNEMEVELKLGGGLSYRFAPKWYVGVEALYETEFETEVGMERWSVFAGPSIHYGSKQWWATLTWFEQLRGGREQYINQPDSELHLIEKTKHEIRLKLGYNF